MLRRYEKKDRIFVAESEAEEQLRPRLPIFVIQQHQSSHLHFDFRLESSGLFKSWELPSGLPQTREERCTAIALDDCSFAKGTHEGVILNEVGGGPVIIWDEGTYL